GRAGQDRCNAEGLIGLSREIDMSRTEGLIMIRLGVFFVTVIYQLLAVVGGAGFVPFDSSPDVALAARSSQPADLLDLNTATADQFKKLPKIDDVYAQKIIEGRPYQRKDELLQKNILPRWMYEQIKYKVLVAGQQLV